MAGGALDSDDDEITGINVTPLVDVMLVLLIIFMVTANYIANQSINVQLPKADTGEAVTSKNLAFVLDKDSHLYFNGKPATFEELHQLIEAEKKSAPQATVQALISADSQTPHGSVVKLIDSVRKNGISDLAINVEQSVDTPPVAR